MAASITLVVPTFDHRVRFVARLLHYLASVRFNHSVVVADSSPPSENEANTRIAADLEGELEVRIEGFRPETNVSLRIAQVLSGVDSEFAVLCADTDFISPSGVDQCARFLQANPDYSVALGHRLSVWTPRQRSPGSARRLKAIASPRGAFESDDPSLRLRDYLRSGTSTYYAVYRRQELIRLMKLAEDETPSGPWGELFVCGLSMIQGKSADVNRLFAVRQRRPDLTSSSRSAGRVSSWLSGDDFSERDQVFRSCLTSELERVASVGRDQAADAVNRAFDSYLGPLVRRSAARGSTPMPGRLSRLSGGVRRVGKMLPDAAKAALLDRGLVGMARAPRIAYDDLRYESKMSSAPRRVSIKDLTDERSPFHGDFAPIYESLVRYPDGIRSRLPLEAV